MRRVLLFMLAVASFLSVPTFALAAGSSSPQEALESLYETSHAVKLETRSLPLRIAFYSNVFVEKMSPYIVDPLGEGELGEVSKGPLYRFDGFDCTTFVETIMALSLSSEPKEFKQTINKIRYKDGRISYQNRNHFPSVDWIPNNTTAGFVDDITGKIAGRQTKWSQTWIEKDNWYRMKGSAFVTMSLSAGKELGRLPYVAKEDLLNNPALEKRIPSGTIFHIVRPNWDLKKGIGTQLDVSHMGFLIRENGILYMVHASNGIRDGGVQYKGVKKDIFRDYIQTVMMESPSMAGFNILHIRER